MQIMPNVAPVYGKIMTFSHQKRDYTTSLHNLIKCCTPVAKKIYNSRQASRLVFFPELVK